MQPAVPAVCIGDGPAAPKMPSQRRNNHAQYVRQRAQAAPGDQGHPGGQTLFYTFVNEYETLYENGKPAPQQMVVANLEAGPTKEEKVNALAEGMRAAVREVLGEDKDLTLVFHDNALDRLAIGGVTIATKMKK